MTRPDFFDEAIAEAEHMVLMRGPLISDSLIRDIMLAGFRAGLDYSREVEQLLIKPRHERELGRAYMLGMKRGYRHATGVGG